MLDLWALPWLDVRKLGCVLDGATPDDRGLGACLAYVGTQPAALVIDGPMFLQTSTVIPSNIQLIFIAGGLIKPDAGIVITLNGSYEAGAWQIWDCGAAGSRITGNMQPKGGRLLTEHWGALGDDASDDSVFFQQTALAAAEAGYLGIQLLNKTYRLGSGVYGGGANAGSFDAPSWYGMGKRRTKLHYPNLMPGTPCLKFIGGSGQLCDATVNDMGFKGNSATIGIMFAGIGGMRAVRCKFEDNVEGIQFHNEAAGSFTEFDTAEHCEFASSCLIPVRYKRTAGNDSFHGSGLSERCTVNTAGGDVLHIDANCKVYNAPIDAQVWATGPVNIINSGMASPSPTFHGTISIETTAPNLVTLGTTTPVYFAGDILINGATTSTGANIQAGTLIRCKTVALHADSSMSASGFERAYSVAIVPGANLLASGKRGTFRLINIRFEGPNYDYRYILGVDHDGFGNSGYNPILSNYRFLNAAGYGAPVFSVNSSGDLTATQANWPASGVNCYWYEMELSPGAQGSSRQQF